MNYFHSLIKILFHPQNNDRKFQALATIIWWKVNQLFLKLPVVIPLLNETKIICHPKSSYGSFVVYVKYPEYLEMKFLEQYLKPRDVFVDVGANIGAWTLIGATQAHKGLVYAFEPTEIFEDLQENIRLNNFSNVITSSLVVSNKKGFEYFATTSESEVSHIQLPTSTEQTDKKRAITLDAYFEFKKNHVNFLKIDVEGAEIKVLKGSKKLLQAGRVDLILFECGPKTEEYGTTFDDLWNFFEKYEYQLFLFSDQGLVPTPRSYVIGTTDNLVAVRTNSAAAKRIRPFLM